MKKRVIISAVAAAAISFVSVAPATAYTEDGLALYIDARNTDSYDPTDPTVVNDISPSGYVGQLVGAVTLDGDNGKWDFTGGGPGSSDINMGVVDFDFTNGMTIEWVSDFGSMDQWERIIDFGDGPHSNNILIAREDNYDNLLLEVFNGGSSMGQVITANYDIVGGETAHWAVTLEADGTLHMFKDGVELAINVGGQIFADGAPYGGVPPTTVRNYGYIGRSLWNDPEFEGSMTFLRVYERALSPEEVAANFACDDATDATCAAAQSNGNGNGLASTGFDATFPVFASLAALALGVAVRRRTRS